MEALSGNPLSLRDLALLRCNITRRMTGFSLILTASLSNGL